MFVKRRKHPAKLMKKVTLNGPNVNYGTDGTMLNVHMPPKSIETIGRPKYRSECKQKFLSKVQQRVSTHFALKPLCNFTQVQKYY